MEDTRAKKRLSLLLPAIGLGVAFDLYGICLWGGSQLFLGVLDGAQTHIYVVTCFAGSLIGFLARPLAALVNKSVARLYDPGIYIAGVLGLGLLLLASFNSNVPVLIGAGLLVGFMISALFMFWFGRVATCTPKTSRTIFVLGMFFSAALNAVFYFVPSGYLLRIVSPVLGTTSLALCALDWLQTRPHTRPPNDLARSHTPYIKAHVLSLSFRELLAPLACALALLLVVPTINYVALEDSLEWQSRYSIILGAQVFAAIVLLILLNAVKRDPLMVIAFIGAVPLLAVALFLFPFLGAGYQYALLLTGSFLHFIVTVLLMVDCAKIAAAENVDPTVIYGPCGALTFIVTYLAAQVMDGILRSSISRDIQMVSTAFFLIYVFGAVFLFVQNRKRERQQSGTEEGGLEASSPRTRVMRWNQDGSEMACCRYIQHQYKLSDRETEIMERLLRGKSAPAIARDLVISPNTVRSHIKRLYRALGVHSRQDLIEHFETLLDEFAH
jgi:DNA-binding CsgD family transcriptional regulator